MHGLASSSIQASDRLEQDGLSLRENHHHLLMLYISLASSCGSIGCKARLIAATTCLYKLATLHTTSEQRFTRLGYLLQDAQGARGVFSAQRPPGYRCRSAKP